jgi:hypothetical protein
MVGDQIVVLGRIGSALVLEPTASVIWRAMKRGATRQELEFALGECFPLVDELERSLALDQIVDRLRAEGLLG